ncbi:hypothetical protein GCM10007380_41070 [Gottfriedia solisilvae]|uniref:Uncharacterized protein n=2 Tax=Gottfriedia solisilvae TaxID=1516104 RepID=A0A8J3F0M2_9BACI|nr:hypothetical protein GCM10007380_41070 [Gottfriedia solisilvae]
MKLFKSSHNYFPTHKSSPIIDTPFGNILMELHVGDYNFANTNTKPECLRLSKGGTLLSYCHNKFIAELVICEPAYNIPNHMAVDKVYAGVWRIKPLINNLKCIFETKLTPKYTNGLVSGPNSGEGLDAITFEYEEIRMTLGTEDGLTLINRSKKKDLMANQFSSFNHEFPDGIIEYIDGYTGLSVSLDELDKNEISQIHFVVAWNNTIDENDVSTWFTVDMSGDEILFKEGLK